MKKWECTVCGYIHEGETPPDECPLCGADSSLFVEVTDASGEPVQQESDSSIHPQSQPVAPSLAGRLQDLIVQFHLHPIAVHAPNGIIPLAFLLLVGAGIFGNDRFDSAALYCLVFVLLNMPFVLYTGYVTWQEKFQGKMTSVFRLKIVSSAVASVLLLFLLFWRLYKPEVLVSGSSAKLLFLLLALLLLGAVGIAGHMGGKLVFGAKKNSDN